MAQVDTGAVAPVPEAFVPHLCLPPLTLVSALMVAILPLAAGSSQAPLLSCAFAFLSSSRMLLLGRGFGCPVLTSFMYF